MKITFLPQRHNVYLIDGELPQEAFDKIVAYQHRLALYVLDHPGAAIFAEGVTDDRVLAKDRTIEAFKKKSAEMAELFPGGTIPRSFSDLNQAQKKALLDGGVTNVLYSLGHVPHIRKTINADDWKAGMRHINKKIFGDGFQELEKLRRAGELFHTPELSALVKHDPAVSHFVFEQREYLAMREIAQFAKNPNSRGKEIILVFGAAHDFKNHYGHCKDVDFQIPFAVEASDRED
ncbi:MAG: hypothetical protein HYR96_01380 [Deltaproteobacteria bacterium]|nr:hypothetical protein [Deltaproteobacteria bacterium]MBI3294369.1 hypothetical protein [Deltaproteobacteria bacterium]